MRVRPAAKVRMIDRRRSCSLRFRLDEPLWRITEAPEDHQTNLGPKPLAAGLLGKTGRSRVGSVHTSRAGASG